MVQGILINVNPDIVGCVGLEGDSRAGDRATDSIDCFHAEGAANITPKGSVGSDVVDVVDSKTNCLLAKSDLGENGKICFCTAVTEAEEQGAGTIFLQSVRLGDPTGEVGSGGCGGGLGVANGGDLPGAFRCQP